MKVEDKTLKLTLTDIKKIQNGLRCSNLDKMFASFG